jgi:hypothetical protein
MGAIYFTTDDGLTLTPDYFDPTWGAEGNRVYIGFSYNPEQATTSKINITLQSLMHLITYYQGALPPSSADTVGTGKFYYDESNSRTTFAWLAQNFLTVQFFLKYASDGSKHSFGFIEEPKLYSNGKDTLFLKIWHNTKETDENLVAPTHMALDLKYYNELTYRDSTTISIKYDVVYPSGESDEKTGYLTYRKKDHLQ